LNNPVKIKNMRTLPIILSSFFLAHSFIGIAQQTSKTAMTASRTADRVSPPKSVTASQADLKLSIEYSSPGVKGRSIWGELVPYGKVWRTGANEASTIEFSRDVLIDGKRVRAGKYALFSIPGEQEWTIILNTNPDQWGAFKYDETKDALRFSVKPQKAPQFNERLTFEAKGDDKTGLITVAFLWENLMLNWEVK
jgi:hypothetical protein